VRVRVDIPQLLPELCEFLEGRGYEVTRGEDQITVLPPQGPQDFQAAITLLTDLDLWRAKHPWAPARLDPELTRT
jgi:hypothetical protein